MLYNYGYRISFASTMPNICERTLLTVTNSEILSAFPWDAIRVYQNCEDKMCNVGLGTKYIYI